jgi:transcriptional regulator with XRE-family HTH domain
MYFETLQGRLLNSVRWRVENGELTERRLAGLIGVSQPHMHNILKGARALSPEKADRILRTLEMSVLDLFLEESSAPPQPAPWPKKPSRRRARSSVSR